MGSKTFALHMNFRLKCGLKVNFIVLLSELMR